MTVRRWVAIALVLAAAGCSRGRQFPDAPILLVCPWAAGGGTDRVARQIAVLLEQDLGVPVNVVNVTGGDGVTGHSRGALARPDGHTLTLVTVEIASLHWRGMTNISHRDFAPIGLVNRDAAAVFVRADAPWRSLRDLENAIRQRPRALRASGTATAGIWHLAVAGWLSAVGLNPGDITWVSIAGAAPSMQELLAGGLDFVSCSLAEAQALLAGGRVRALGVMADERVPQFPNVLTFAELGIGWSLGTIRGVAAPKDTPAERVATLAAALERVVEGEAYRRALLQSGFTPAYQQPAAFRATLENMDTRLGGLLTSDAFRGVGSTRFGPMFFPSILIGALVIVVALLLWAARAAREPAAADRPPAQPGANWRAAEVVIWVAAYVALAEPLGFVITAALLLFAYLYRLGTRLPVAAALALTLVPAVYQLFAVALRVPLPRGVLGW
jgi:tripartite-type tricarboxylate transporter receptor subunit TctC